MLPSHAAKRLTARGVAANSVVRKAMAEGMVVIGLGTTNAYVAEELLGGPIDPGSFCAGYIGRGLSVVPPERMGRGITLVAGQPASLDPEQVRERLKPGDVLIKGANALDPHGICGVLLGSRTGGTVGAYHPAALATGAETVVPISLAKSVHTPIAQLARAMGAGRLAHAHGIPVGMYPLVGTPLTEREALETLYGVRVQHVASGGVGHGTGAVTLLLEGAPQDVAQAFDALTALAAEQEIPWDDNG